MKRILLVHWPLAVFVLLFVLLSVVFGKDFGVAWDEQEIYARSAFLLKYLTGNVDYVLYLKDVYGILYSHLYGLPLVILNPKGTFGAYHILNLVFSLPMFISAYLLLFKKYKKVSYSVIGVLFLLLIPSLLGHIPINPKDGPFAVFYYVALASIYLSSGVKDKRIKILILGLAFGIAQSARLVGFSLYVIYFLYEFYSHHDKKITAKIWDILINTLLIFLVANFLLVVFWPYLGANYLVHISELFLTAKNFPWDGPVLFEGEMINASKLPLTYLPTLFLYTTPIFILLSFALFIMNVKKSIKNNLMFLVVLAFGINAILYFLLKPVVYDGLRHYLFLLPIIGTIAAVCFIEFILKAKKTSFRKIIIILFTLNAFKVATEMIMLHPYEYIYFNELIGGLSGAYERYETEYMGTSNKEAIIWLKNNEVHDSIDYYVTNCGHPFSGMYYLRENMHWTDKAEEADYNVCYTRFNQHKLISDDKTIHVVKRLGVPINYIRKL